MRIALANADPRSLISWLLYAVSPDGKGIDKPWGWALAQLRDAPEMGAGAAYDTLAALPPHETGPIDSVFKREINKPLPKHRGVYPRITDGG